MSVSLPALAPLIVLLLHPSTEAGPDAFDAVVQDPAPDLGHPARIAGAAIPSDGVLLNGLVYVASGAGPKPAMILLHGFPGNERNLDLAQAVRRAGWTVLTFNYRGNWGTPGAFSFQNAIEDGRAAIAFLREPVNAERYGIDPARIVIVGHSMGGVVASRAADERLAGVGLIDAWNISNLVPLVRDPDDQQAALAFFGAAMPALAGTSPETLAEEARQKAAGWDISKDGPRLARTPLFLVAANRARHVDTHRAIAKGARAVPGAQVTDLYMDTDHSFSDHRIALSRAVVEWLQGLEM